MNNKILTYLVLIFASFFFSCRGPVKQENKSTASATSIFSRSGNEKIFVIDTKESQVTWKGSMLFGSNSHSGYIYISKGELMMENGQLMGGTVEVDMNTIEDKVHGRNNGLVNHLKDPDFFDVKKFPFSTIVITGASSISAGDKEISGNLTIKGITHPVSFPAKVELQGETFKGEGKLVIDRTKWDVRYNSGKFFDDLKDNAIADDIEFDIKIVAKK